MDKIAILERLLDIAKEEKELLGELTGIGLPAKKNETSENGGLENALKKQLEQQLEEIKEQANKAIKNREGQKNPNFPPKVSYLAQE